MKTKEYRGYVGEYDFYPNDNVWIGKVITNKGDLMTFQSKTNKNIQKEFEISVDKYIEMIRCLNR